MAATPPPLDPQSTVSVRDIAGGGSVDGARSIRVVTIERPEVRNAVDGPTAQLLYDAFVQIDRDPSIGAAILTGAEGTFCAGADLGAVSAGRGNRVGEEPGDTIVGTLGPMGPTRLDLDTPVIAAVEGYAVAGGLELALWCDLRVAADDAAFGVFCRRWGVPLIDGGTVRLPRLIGESVATDLILTGREVAADEAWRIGLANRVVPSGAALTEAVELARRIVAFPPRCVDSDRRSSRDQHGQSLGEALAHEVALGMATIRSGETRRGASRFAAGEGRHGAGT
ncbi:MAG: crotonase/enoyl-CoA hydratase family protein [Actinomycetota bacterium]